MIKIKIIQKLSLFSLMASLLLISACGKKSDSNTDTDTDPNKEFSTASLRPVTLGEVYKAKLTGTLSQSGDDDIKFDGSINVVTKASIVESGVTLFPTELILIITDPTTSGVISKSTITQYISAASKIVRKISIVDTNSAITCLVNNDPDDMPAKIKIGSKGKTPAYTCDNSTTETGTWEVKDGKNGKINYIEKNTEGTTTATTTLDGDGKIVAYASNSVLDNGGTVDLKSD